jgi:hypothetical protein
MARRASNASGTSRKGKLVAGTASVEETIRRRAYELYLERGAAHGNEMDDWLRAEREISPQHQRRRRQS